MQCPQCQQPSDESAAFCGNCGAPLTVGSARQASAEVAFAVPAEAASTKSRDHSGKAIAATVLGLVGLGAWLVPIAGLAVGLLAMVLGTIAFHSRHRAFARSGIALSAIVLAASLFMWVHSVQQLQHGGTPTAQADAALQTVVTPCYSTKVNGSLQLTTTNGSCTFQGTNRLTGEEQMVKVLNVPGLSQANLNDVAQQDAASVAQQTPGGKLRDERSALFAGSSAYQVTITVQGGSGGTIDYVYNPTAQGNLLIVTHSQVHVSGNNADLNTIESNWSWQ